MDASKPNSESSWVDPDDAPEWTPEMFDRAEIRIGDRVIHRGRPPGSAKTPAGIGQDPRRGPANPRPSLRLDQDLIAAFRAQGPGWNRA